MTSSPKSTRTPGTLRTPGKRGRYHHGNLRAALVEAAGALVEEQGTRALTLREVARRVGVTHAAPYRHFKDKAALLGALAENSYAQLFDDMRSEIASGADVKMGIMGAAGAYVRFATAHRASYEVMFTVESGKAVRVLAELRRALEPLPLDAEQRDRTAAAIWAQCHGLALLANSGRLQVAEPERHARDATALLLALRGDPAVGGA